MSFSSGVFTRIYNWTTEQVSSPIEIAKLDTQEEDIATALSNCILRDGTGVPTAATPWNSQRISGLGAPTTTGDAANLVFSSFTGTLTGGGASTETVYYRITGNVSTLWIESNAHATSSSTALTMTGLPSACQPAHNVYVPCEMLDNSSSTSGFAQIVAASPSIIVFHKSAVSGAVISYNSAGFTASGNKGLSNGWSISYPL